MREDLIISLAENITMVMIMSALLGLVIGWYFTYLYYHSHDPEAEDMPEVWDDLDRQCIAYRMRIIHLEEEIENLKRSNPKT